MRHLSECCDPLGRARRGGQDARGATGVSQWTRSKLLASLGLPQFLGMTVTTAEPDRVVAELMVAEEHCTIGHTIHGGAIMAFADTLGALGTVLNLRDGPIHHDVGEQDQFLCRRAGRQPAGGGERAAASRPPHPGLGNPPHRRERTAGGEGHANAIGTMTSARATGCDARARIALPTFLAVRVRRCRPMPRGAERFGNGIGRE